MSQANIPPQQNPIQNEVHSPHKATDDKEEIYFHGSPMIRGELSHVFLMWLIGLIFIAIPIAIKMLNKAGEFPHWGVTLGCIVVGLIFLTIPILRIKSLRYRISNYRIDVEKGILGKRIDTLELWHIEDIRFEQSFLDRLFGVGTVTIISNDDTTPKLAMMSLPNPRPLFETLKQRVIAVKRQRGVIKMDTGGHAEAG